MKLACLSFLTASVFGSYTGLINRNAVKMINSKDFSALSPAGAFTVVKGQSAEFSQIKQMSGADNAVHTETSTNALKVEIEYN